MISPTRRGRKLSPVTSTASIRSSRNTRQSRRRRHHARSDPRRGRYLSWLSYYGGVVEPVFVAAHAGIDHPVLQVTWRGLPELTARLSAALTHAPWLMGDRYTAADLLLASPYQWFPNALPDDPAIRDWSAAVAAHENRLLAA